MKRGYTLIELLIAIAIVAIFVGLVASGVRHFGKPQVVATQPLGKVTAEKPAVAAEAAGTRSLVKVHYSQIESYLAGVPGSTKIVAVIPVYSGSGDTFDIKHYLVVLE
jgi:prepilin-type N-terminal cleavage/methylation domain-containing protein